MAGGLIAPMPVVVLDYNCRIVFEAVDPTTGAAVAGVKVVSPSVYGENLATLVDDRQAGAPLPPLYVSLADQPTTEGVG